MIDEAKTTKSRAMERREEFIFRAAKWPVQDRFAWLGNAYALLTLLENRINQLKKEES